MPSKPRITPWNGFYRCDGDGVAGFGVTAESAWHQWRAMLPKDMRPPIKLKGARFVAKMPAHSTPAEDMLLMALAAWEPTHAH